MIVAHRVEGRSSLSSDLEAVGISFPTTQIRWLVGAGINCLYILS